MENQIGAYEDGGGGGGGGPYHPLPAINCEVAAATYDAGRLNKLGYKQELSRSLSAIANFSVTFSIISVITGITTTFNTGLTYGGPLTVIWGWPIVGLLTLIVGLSMAEICSAYPTSGGLYFWSAKLCGNDWGPLASWLTGCPARSLYNIGLACELCMALISGPIAPEIATVSNPQSKQLSWPNDL